MVYLLARKSATGAPATVAAYWISVWVKFAVCCVYSWLYLKNAAGTKLFRVTIAAYPACISVDWPTIHA